MGYTDYRKRTRFREKTILIKSETYVGGWSISTSWTKFTRVCMVHQNKTGKFGWSCGEGRGGEGGKLGHRKDREPIITCLPISYICNLGRANKLHSSAVWTAIWPHAFVATPPTIYTWFPPQSRETPPIRLCGLPHRVPRPKPSLGLALTPLISPQLQVQTQARTQKTFARRTRVSIKRT